MAVKNIIFSDEHKKNVKEGLDLVYNAVSKTMGPGGSTVFIEREYLPPLITKDGATVAENIFVDDNKAPIVNLIKSITKKAALESGDGTTSTTVLTKALYDSFYRRVAKDNSKIRMLELAKSLKTISNTVVEMVRSFSTSVSSIEDLKNIVSVSTNNDSYMTDLIMKSLSIDSDAEIDKAKSREIVVSISRTGKDYLDIVNGSRYDCGYPNSAFCNDKTKTKIEYDNPYILVTSDKIYNLNQVVGVLNLAKQDNKPIVIFAPEVNQDVLATLAVNKLKMVVDVAVVNAPGFGGLSTDNYLEDIALLSGATLIKNGTANNFDNLSETYIGRKVSNIVVESNRTTIISTVDDSIISNKINELEKMKVEAGNNTVLVDSINKRITKLSAGITTIYIASESDVETFERKDRLDDAIGSLKSALQEGYVPGAGSTLRYISKRLAAEYKKPASEEEKLALNMVIDALRAPEITICENANCSKLRDALDSKDTEFGIGINVHKNESVNLIKEGIIDPTKVLVCALTYSISLVSTLISSSLSILNKNRSS